MPGALLLAVGQTLVVALAAGAGPVDVTLRAEADTRLTIVARSRPAGALDVTLTLYCAGQVLAFSDDAHAGLAGLHAGDAALADIRLPPAADCALRVDSFNGAQTGAVALGLRAEPTVPPCQRPLHTLRLPPWGTAACALGLQPGERLTVCARALSGALDPMLALLDATGATLAANDDHSMVTADCGLRAARVDFRAPAGGMYTLRAWAFDGAAGALQLRLAP